MPKAKKRRVSATGKANSTQGTGSNSRRDTTSPSNVAVKANNRRRFNTKAGDIQSLLFSGLVTLGCWGMAFSFFFLYNDPNHVLFGGMAVLMAAIWTFSLGLRVRKLRQQRA